MPSKNETEPLTEDDPLVTGPALEVANASLPSSWPVCLAERVRRVMSAIGGIAKEGEYRAGSVSYNYRGIEQITPKVRDALIEQGVIIVPTRAVLDVSEREPVTKGDKVTVSVRADATMTYRMVNCDDPHDWLEVQMIASAVDTGDKYVTKALTSAFKYLMLQALCIADPTDDQDRYDADGDDHSSARSDEPLSEWPATEAEVETLRVATAMMSDASKATFAAWWKDVRAGSLKEGHVNGRHVPAALALVQVLLDAEAAAEPPL